jgi:hypothetical protein
MEAMGLDGQSVAETVTSETATKRAAEPTGSRKTTVEADTAVESTVAPKSAVTSKPSVTAGLGEAASRSATAREEMQAAFLI